jgi:hypothetical protein
MVHWKKRQKIKADLEAENNNPERKVVLSEKVIAGLNAYIRKHYVKPPKTHEEFPSSAMKAGVISGVAFLSLNKEMDKYIKEKLNQNESFAKFYTKQMEERGLTFKEICKSLDFDRKRIEAFELDSDINPYRPTKNYAILMGMKLQMDLEEMQALLAKAGYTLSDSDIKDLTIKYCIEKKIYDCYKVDALVYEKTGKSLKKVHEKKQKPKSLNKSPL